MHEKLQGKVYEFGEAYVEVSFLPNRKKYQFLIDVGFNGSLCLPKRIAEELQLKAEGQTTSSKIDNNEEGLDIAFAEIEWLEKNEEVVVLINNGEDFLLGTALLENRELYINFKTGEVLIWEEISF